MEVFALYHQLELIGIFEDEEYVDNFCKEKNSNLIKETKEKILLEREEHLKDLETWYWTFHEDFDEEIIMTNKGLMYNDLEDLNEAKMIIKTEKWFFNRLTGNLMGKKKYKYETFEFNQIKEK